MLHPIHPHYFIKKMLMKNFSSVITMVIFTYNCVFHSSILVSVGCQKCSLVWHTSKHRVAHNPYVSFLTLVFCSCFFVFGSTWHRILLHCMSQYLLCLESSLCIWIVEGACLLCLVVWGRGTLPVPYTRTLTNVSLNCWCDNFEPREVRMIKLLRMVRSRRWKNGFFVHFQVHLLIELRCYHVVRFVYKSHVSIIVLYHGQLHGFSMFTIEITLQLQRMYVHQCVPFLFVLPHYGCQVIFTLIFRSPLFIFTWCSKFFGILFLFGLTVPQQFTALVSKSSNDAEDEK